MVKKHNITKLVTDIKDELTLKNEISLLETKKGYYTQLEYFKFSIIKITSSIATELFVKVKLSRAMQKFERVHNARCVLDKRLGKWVIKINF